MFDLNAIVSAAISAAITEATKPLLERIATLESANDILHRTQHEDMVAMRDRIAALEGDISHRAQVQQANITAALAERIAALEEKVNFLEDQAIVTSNRINDRIATLENNPAQGVDTTLLQRVAALESETQGENRYLNRDDVAELIAEAMDDHCETYDHDNYDEMASKVDDLPDNLDDYATRDELRSEIEDVLNNATLSLSI